ncbi:MAG: uroporphyrinogen decarboxylase [Cardiobacteriaceae bacterium]|nr:uroporphyrinogen decarboxylase [Cardiobacteriaceae bacterium]
MTTTTSKREPLKNDRFLKALWGQPIDRTPAWIMRQAGRYLPEYRETRAKAGDFLSLCKNAELACEVTLQPLRRYPLDAAILFSDILTIPDAMGLGLRFEAGEGPKFARPIRSVEAAKALCVPEAGSLDYVGNAVKTIKRELNQQVPLIGFSGSPWTLATYMIEGGGSKDHAKSKAFAYEHPEAMHALLQTLAQAVADYLQMQIEAGVDAVMIFDTWGGLLPYRAYPEFSLRYMREVFSRLPHDVPKVMFTKGGGMWLEQMVDSGAQGIGLDWTVSLKSARERTGHQLTLQGNLDPSILLTNPETIKREVAAVLADYGHGHRHIFNLGHGITPDVPPEHLSVVLETLAELSPQYHR